MGSHVQSGGGGLLLASYIFEIKEKIMKLKVKEYYVTPPPTDSDFENFLFLFFGAFFACQDFLG